MQLLLRYCSVYPILFARVEIRQDGHSTMCTMTDRPRSKSAKQLSLYLFGHLYYCLYLIATLNPTNIECARMSHSQSGSWLPPFPHRVVLSHSAAAARAEQSSRQQRRHVISSLHAQNRRRRPALYRNLLFSPSYNGAQVFGQKSGATL